MSEKNRKLLPSSVLIAWVIISLFSPFAVFYYAIAGFIMATVGNNIIYSLLWAWIPLDANHDLAGTSVFGIFLPVSPENPLYGLHILNPLIMVWIPLFGFFNIVFTILVIRYMQGKTSLMKTLITGVLTLVIPLYQTFSFEPYLLSIGHPSYIGPLPIQLIIGLTLARKYRPQSIDKPWQ